MSYNCAEREIETDQAEGSELVGTKGFKLTGTQAKTKRCIEINVEKMAREVGVGRVGFLTLTVGDWCDEAQKFVQVWSIEEANKRIHTIARRFLPSLFRRWVIVTERHVSGAVHFHLCVELPFECREGYDWTAVRSGDYSSANPALRALWAKLREELPKFGFGRAQLEPAKGMESMARYVAKYVEKNLFNRPKSDKGKRLVRYGGWKKGHTRPCDICWSTPAACRWRITAQAFAMEARGFTRREQVAESLGPRWAHRLSNHFPDWDFFDREHTKELWRRMEKQRHREAVKRTFLPDIWERPLTAAEVDQLNRDLRAAADEAEMNVNW